MLHKSFYFQLLTVHRMKRITPKSSAVLKNKLQNLPKYQAALKNWHLNLILQQQELQQAKKLHNFLEGKN